MKFWQRFWADEEGQGFLEYALIIGLIVLIVVGVVRTLGQNIASNFEKINAELTKEAPPSPGP